MAFGLVDSPREAACLVVSVVLVVGGMLLTAILPDDPLSQVAAGGTIVAGFALAFVCLSEW